MKRYGVIIFKRLCRIFNLSRENPCFPGRDSWFCLASGHYRPMFSMAGDLYFFNPPGTILSQWGSFVSRLSESKL
jgi:hypothetical protein